jgi:hypothetical protein
MAMKQPLRILLHKQTEMARLSKLQGKRLKELLSRRVKAHGSSYPLSGNIPDLCAAINSIDANFFSIRYCVLFYVFIIECPECVLYCVDYCPLKQQRRQNLCLIYLLVESEFN